VTRLLVHRDHVDAAHQHFEHAKLSFAAVSRVPLRRIEEVKNRMGWTFSCVSSRDSDFNSISACRSRPRTLPPAARSTITAQ